MCRGRTAELETKPKAIHYLFCIPAGGSALQQYGKAGGMLLAQSRRAWGDSFSLLAAMKVDHTVTALHLLTDPRTGACRALVVGDSSGSLTFFCASGELLAQYNTGADRAYSRENRFAE